MCHITTYTYYVLHALMVPNGSMVNGFIYSDKCILHKFSDFVCGAQAVEALQDSMCHRKKSTLTSNESLWNKFNLVVNITSHTYALNTHYTTFMWMGKKFICHSANLCIELWNDSELTSHQSTKSTTYCWRTKQFISSY